MTIVLKVSNISFEYRSSHVYFFVHGSSALFIKDDGHTMSHLVSDYF